MKKIIFIKKIKCEKKIEYFLFETLLKTTMDTMDEVFTEILTTKKVYNSYQNLVDYWHSCGNEKYIHFEIGDTDFDDWYVDAYKDFANWYCSCIWNDKFEINSNMVRLAMEYERDNFGEIFLNDEIDNETEFNKHIICVLIIVYLEDEYNIHTTKFRNAMKENYNYIKERDNE